MKTPDVIYLIDMGDEVVWCDDPAPDHAIDPDESVRYIKAMPKRCPSCDVAVTNTQEICMRCQESIEED